MTLNGLIVDFIAVGGAVILTAAGMGVVLLLTEDRRGRIFMQEIPAKFLAIVATPEGTPSEWTGPMHAAAPSALRAARHLAGLGHLLRPKGISEGRAAKLARQVYRRALLARSQVPIRGAAQGRAGGCAPAGDRCPSDLAPESRPAARADLTGSLAPRPPMEDPGPVAHAGPGTQDGPPRAQPAPVPVAAPPAAAVSTLPHVLPPLPPEIPAPDCDYLPAAPFADWLRDSFVGAIPAVK